MYSFSCFYGGRRTCPFFEMAKELGGILIAPVVVQYHKTVFVRQLHRNFFAWRHARSDSMIVIRQLIATQNSHLAHETMIMALLERVGAFTVRRVLIGYIACRIQIGNVS